MLRRRHCYERLKAQGRPARCPIEQRTDAAVEGFLAAYCPVCLTVDNALRDCSESPEFLVEAKGARFSCCTAEHLNLLLAQPKPYFQQQLPELLPRRLSEDLLDETAVLALNGYCPVTLERELSSPRGLQAARGWGSPPGPWLGSPRLRGIDDPRSSTPLVPLQQQQQQQMLLLLLLQLKRD
ncbi:uncharacterized protein EMH_0091330 [Eimeria mitis]|uniref:Uncharacterized protein n=1 Tax=Eimeria mitis TaxID=44415 RepID=U6KCT6_9EIME|nr:uncharacterized protein EMH_0091330 [Eimeria mitis]CDJ34606.1 hypothetical protein EMH_0091330 [Eimeria mitis]